MDKLDQQLEALVSRWRQAAANVLPGVPEEDLSAFERRFGLRLPIAFRNYLQLANGMANGDLDGGDLVHFWNLSEMADHLGEQGIVQRYPFVPFADYSLDCWTWVLPLDLDGRVSDAVFTYGPPLESCAASFSMFVARYLCGESQAPKTLAPRVHPHWKSAK